MTHTPTSEMDKIVHDNKFEKFADVDNRFLQRVPAISSNRETSPPNPACTADSMDVRLRSGSMSSAYHAEFEESDSDSDRDCNAIDMSVIKNAASLQMRERAVEQMDIDIPMCGRSRMSSNNNIMESEHGPHHHHQQHHHPPPPQLIMRDPHAPREDLRRITNNSPLGSSASSSPSLLLNGVHESHGRPNSLAGPPLPPPPFLSQLGQPPTQHLMQQQMQHHGGIILGTNDSKGRHSSFSSVISSDGAVSPPPHTLPNPSMTPHPNPLNQHQLSFVPQHIPHDLVHKMNSGQKKKLPTPIPKECKDEAYWERRKRNNESAKRSRELRRIKEQQTTLRVLYLEQENLQLRTELGMLRSEVDKLRQLLYVTNKQSSTNGRTHSQQHQLPQQQQQLSSHPLNPQPDSPDQVVGSGTALSSQDAQYLNRPSVSPPPRRVAPVGGEHSSNPQQRLPPIATLQQPQLQMRRIILASPPSSRPMVPSSASSSSSHVVVSLSRSPSPQGRDSRREISISPISSSPDATDLSPLPHRVALTPPSPTEVCVRPLELGQPASSDPQTSNTSDSSCQSHMSGGSCSPPTASVQQHPLQPAILRHKKARPSSPLIGGVSLSQHQTSQAPTPQSSIANNKQLHAMAQREFRDSQQDGPPRGIDVARLRQRNPNLHYEPRLVAPTLAA